MADVIIRSKSRPSGIFKILLGDLIAAILSLIFSLVFVFLIVLPGVAALSMFIFIISVIRMIFVDILRYCRSYVEITSEGLRGIANDGKKFRLGFNEVAYLNSFENLTIHAIIKKQGGKTEKKEYKIKNISNVQEVCDAYNQYKRAPSEPQA